MQVFVHYQDGNATTSDSGQFSIQTINSTPGWADADVGAVAAAGSASYDSATGKWTVSGDGADIWGTADAFHYVYTTMSTSEFEVQLRVDSMESVNAWTKAGLMIRESLDADAVHASIFATPLPNGSGVIANPTSS